jgi:hypothetical protein
MTKMEREMIEVAVAGLEQALDDPDNDLFAHAEATRAVLKQALALPTVDTFDFGVRAERQRVLQVLAGVPRAALDDGRDLVVRTDAVRKVEHP